MYLGKWIDYSGGAVSGKTMADNGIEGAIRYVGIGGAGKRLTRAEYSDHCDHGRQTLAVVEMSTTDADGGYAAGLRNARAAMADLAVETQGLPPITGVLAANDKPSYVQADVDYVRAFRDVFGDVVDVGPYGFGSFLAACSSAGLASIAWQAGPAPSRTGTSSIATFWQRQGGAVGPTDGPTLPVTIVLDGITCDLSNRLKELPMTAPTPQQIASAILDTPITRAGAGETGTTSLRTILAWTDYAWSLGRVETDAQAQQVLAAFKTLTTATVDVQALAAALGPLLSADEGAALVAALKTQFEK